MTNDYQEEYTKLLEQQSEAMGKLLESQRNTLNRIYKAMDDINDEYCESYDVSSELMRNLQQALWAFRRDFNFKG
jgi:plasmid maintenance system antidote protein VapI|tara:strand:+ start:162 stop:386 length:225 start_codon:yes stop_codon:yes gene_type:complete